MTIERFEYLLLAYGADPARWPQHERDAAQALAMDNAQARAMLADARALEAALRHALAAKPAGAALNGRIQAHIAARANAGFAAVTRGWQLAFGAAAMAAIMLGFFTGLTAGNLDIFDFGTANALNAIVDQPFDVVELL